MTMTRRIWMLTAVAALCVLAVGLLTTAAPAQEGELEIGIDQLHHNMMSQLAGIWSQLVQGVAQDTEFLDSAQGQALMERQEALMQIRWMMMEGMSPPGREMGMDDRPGSEGCFEFVSWIELDRTYWVLDTRTGRMHPRECPEREMDEGEMDDG